MTLKLLEINVMLVRSLLINKLNIVIFVEFRFAQLVDINKENSKIQIFLVKFAQSAIENSLWNNGMKNTKKNCLFMTK